MEPLENDKMLVVVDGSVGVVTYDGFRFTCSVCSNTYCRHAKHIKKLKAEGDNNIELKDFFSKTKRSPKGKKRSNLYLGRKYLSFRPRTWKKSLLSVQSN